MRFVFTIDHAIIILQGTYKSQHYIKEKFRSLTKRRVTVLEYVAYYNDYNID